MPNLSTDFWVKRWKFFTRYLRNNNPYSNRPAMHNNNLQFARGFCWKEDDEPYNSWWYAANGFHITSIPNRRPITDCKLNIKLTLKPILMDTQFTPTKFNLSLVPVWLNGVDVLFSPLFVANQLNPGYYLQQRQFCDIHGLKSERGDINDDHWDPIFGSNMGYFPNDEDLNNSAFNDPKIQCTRIWHSHPGISAIAAIEQKMEFDLTGKQYDAIQIRPTVIGDNMNVLTGGTQTIQWVAEWDITLTGQGLPRESSDIRVLNNINVVSDWCNRDNSAPEALAVAANKYMLWWYYRMYDFGGGRTGAYLIVPPWQRYHKSWMDMHTDVNNNALPSGFTPINPDTIAQLTDFISNPTEDYLW